MTTHPFGLVSRAFRLFALALCITALAAVVAVRAETAVVTGFELEGSAVTIEIDGEPSSELILLENPYRIALDLADTLAAARPGNASASGPVASMRDGLVSPALYRVLFQLSEPAVPRFTSTSEDGRTVLRIEFEEADEEAFAAAVAERAGRGVAPEGAEPEAAEARRPVIVIDPGHGGADYGAVGEGGTLEKELNLAFARVLKSALEDGPRPVEVSLTREDDTLVPLAERSAIARRAGADLFVSVHADSIRHRDLRGATVYTLSATASDSLAGEIAEGENAADRFVGPEWTQDTPEIHGILVDLVKRETETLSRRFADELVLTLRREGVRLMNNPKRSAGFRVLTAPDVPSVLLEMGFLSNVEDETLMSDPTWQKETASVVAAAIGAFLDAR